MTSQARAKDSRIASAIRVLEKRKSTDLARQLAGPLFARTNPEDLAAYPPEALAQLIR